MPLALIALCEHNQYTLVFKLRSNLKYVLCELWVSYLCLYFNWPFEELGCVCVDAQVWVSVCFVSEYWL